MSLINIYNMDCMAAMKEMPDKAFELAIVDPPYGINRFKNNQPTRLNKYGLMTTVNDLRPNEQYFSELFRVSKNQIIWGFNHLCDMLPTTKEFLFWYKHQPLPTYSDGELAWTSFDKTAHLIDLPYYGSVGVDFDGRIHPTQKPVALYKWLLCNYAKQGDKILDTHLGSGSIAIACHDLVFDLTGYELDPEYFAAAKRRIDEHSKQGQLFVG